MLIPTYILYAIYNYKDQLENFKHHVGLIELVEDAVVTNFFE